MAMDIGRLALALKNDFVALYTPANMLSNYGNRLYTIEQMSFIIASRVIEEITGHAKCSGLDSHSDSHDNVGIV